MPQNDILPVGFIFSQSSLQDFVDCPRRFQLRYMWELAWPAVETEPVLENERFIRRGAFFHQLVHQHLSGIAEELLDKMIDAFEAGDKPEENDLAQWWKNYLAWKEWEEGTNLYPEISLSAPLEEYRLVAKYDLILVRENDLITIVDWKTSRKRPQIQYLKERLQSRIYPYLVVSAGEQLIKGEEVRPEMVEMVYWFTNYPQQPMRFKYTSSHYMEDKAHISDLVAKITRLEPDGFTLTTRIERCAYCSYRSFCNRGIRAGDFDELEEIQVTENGAGIMLDFEQIGEIEY